MIKFNVTNIYIIIIYFCFSNQAIIKNGVYNLITDDLYLYYYKRYLYLSEFFFHPNTYFRIKKMEKIGNDFYYNIEEIYTSYLLSFLTNKLLKFKNPEINSCLWKFIEVSDKNYVIKNKKNCFIIINDTEVICDFITIDQATQFKLIKIYTEVEKRNSITYKSILNQEPIDILIKYIDLRDDDLKRGTIHQIEKDYDNEELRYSVRSILKNIPWIRKIFILMPNKKVRYFKDYNLINDKIIYVQDKDLLGYESSNSLAFQYRYWKMKKFGISNNIIVMDDDCFIGNKLEKSDFFYVKNGVVIPLIITSKFIKIDNKNVESNCEIYKKLAKNSKEEQNDDVFNYSKYLTYKFVLDLFNISSNESIYIPKYTHNAIPVNLDNIKEIYDLVYLSKYKETTLDSLYRSNEYLQFQMLILSYTFIKYSRKVKDVGYKFIKINNSIYANYNFSLFCINKGPANYSYLVYYKAKIVMEYLFPYPTKYEKVDYSILNLSLNAINSVEKELETYKDLLLQSKKDIFFFIYCFFLLFVFTLFKFTYIYNKLNYK